MATDPRNQPNTRTGAANKPARDDEDRRARRVADAEREAHHGDPTGEHGDRMPLGADEPGAGL